MASIHTLIDLFAVAPTLANAKKIVAKTIHNPMSVCLIHAHDHGHIEAARQIVADAKAATRVVEA